MLRLSRGTQQLEGAFAERLPAKAFRCLGELFSTANPTE